MKDNRQSIKDKIKSDSTNCANIIWLIISIIIVCLPLLSVAIMNASNLVIYNPFDTSIITIISEDKNWQENENINLFKNLNSKGEKIIWPGQSGAYNLIVKNDTHQATYYKLLMEDINDYDINMKFRLKMNNAYVIGDEQTWVKINDVLINEIYAAKDSTTLYTIEWQWEKSDRDLELAEGIAQYIVYIKLGAV